ncbi:OLC1v1012325C1 [Oldenlandia corymbosa var. corymbosa]|uniref:OLC1v1012325C1 n=1 Tax=Oldenlandia corymbosa var. corymbosa TaxID=529605 RepID=A0AAV1DVU1_OLDCO|nr:OLC1v1012325C1 [Oldenlandia corymbosa var. corymbosa]
MEQIQDEEITEEQRKRIEANRQAALAKRKAITVHNDPKNSSSNSKPNQFQNDWRHVKCRKLSSEPGIDDSEKPIYPFVNTGSIPKPQLALSPPPPTEKFRARFEICSPDSFSITPEPVPGFAYPGEEACFEKISLWLSDVLPSHFTQNIEGGKASVFKLWQYVSILRSLKSCEGIDCKEIPWGTFKVIETMAESYGSGKWKPCRPEFLPDEMVDELISDLPQKLIDALLPFQLEGIRFGIRRGGRCLIADEMGLGKTIQAIAIAGCFRDEGSVLIICPAILRYSWAEELERWFPFCVPSDIHLVFSRKDNPANLAKYPKIVVISYRMLHHLEKSMLQQEWATLIVDESHHLRCTKKSESEETKAVLDVAVKVKHLILLSGTPSLSRPFEIFHQINMLWPGLLGKTKFDFAKTYCSPKSFSGCQGKVFQDFSKGIRLEELNILLKQTVMIRRLKYHVLAQLPPIRRQIIRLDLTTSDYASAMAALGLVLTRSEVVSAVSALGGIDGDAPAIDSEDETSELPVEGQGKSNVLWEIPRKEDQILGMAKLRGFFEWLSMHPSITSLDVEEDTEESLSSQKMIIFAHHHIVCDRIQEFLMEKGIDVIRINSHVSSTDRNEAVQSFQSSAKVKIAIIGIMAGGVGLNLTAAQNVVFLELPREIAYLNQAESRVHRLGQTKAVNIYVFCAKGTSDESRWQKLNRSLFQVSHIMNGKREAIPMIKVETISCLEATGGAVARNQELVVEQQIDRDVSANYLKGQESCSNDSNPCVHEEHHDISKLASPHFECRESSVEAISETSGSISSDSLENSMVTAEDEIALHNVGPSGQIEVMGNSFIQVAFLRFEVSQYTGRIHLYSCIPGRDSRPQPLFLNFRQQEVEANEPSEDGSETANTSEEDHNYYRSAVQLFLKEWNQLRPIERRKLFLKPLQLPLTVELCYLAEAINHDKMGLLKGGSKRRSTPYNEISQPLPPDASWRKVLLRGSQGKEEKTYRQGWSAMEEPLCKLCQSPCMNGNSKTPDYFEELFCNLGCFQEYKIRTSGPALREALFQVERGICTFCKLDCHGLVAKLRPLSIENRQEFIRKAAPELARRKKLFDKLVKYPKEGNAWHADHIVPVHRGGGECTLENLRTLCVSCHADVTSAQNTKRAKDQVTDAQAKKRLKVAMKNLKNPRKPGEIDVRPEGNEEMEDEQNLVEELIVEVPGSAYSGPQPDAPTGSE